MKFCIEVQPYKNSLWVQRGSYYKTMEEAEEALPYFTDGSPTGPWKGARIRPLRRYELKELEHETKENSNALG